MHLSKKKNSLLISVILIVVAINVVSFCLAYPQTLKPESGNLARDFSAYYIGEWRLFHNPTQIYYGGSLPTDYQILPQPQSFKYTPSFMILFAPFLTLNYQDALFVFDIVQIALIPALAFFTYKLVKDKNLSLAAIVALIVIVEPLPTPPLYQTSIDIFHFQLTNLIPQSFAPVYSIGYAVVNAHVLQTILLVGALYFGFSKKPWLSALLFTFGAFDPRAALFALPLILWYNRLKLSQFIIGTIVFVVVTNLPFFFYYGVGFTFLRTEVIGSIVSQMYPYDWLPLYAVAALMVMEIINLGNNSGTGNLPISQEKMKN